MFMGKIVWLSSLFVADFVPNTFLNIHSAVFRIYIYIYISVQAFSGNRTHDLVQNFGIVDKSFNVSFTHFSSDKCKNRQKKLLSVHMIL